MPDGAGAGTTRPIEVKPKSKDPMHATWHLRDPKEWTYSQRRMARLKVLPNFPGEKKAPVRKLGDPVPVYRIRDQYKMIAPYVIIPLALHYAYMRYTGKDFHPVAAYVLYSAAYQSFSLASTRVATALGQKYGYFDGEHPRDMVPDDKCDYVMIEVLKVIFLRPLLLVMATFDRTELPNISIFMPLKLFAWSITFDFYFFVYHASMHNIPWLWRFHAKHHTTKHPNSLLSAYADAEQELADAFLIPSLTYLTLRPYFNFSEIFVCHMCIIVAESAGHSGARIYAGSLMNWAILRPFRCELSVEDHDWHHRRGYRHLGKNLGKQTLLWDRLAGTVGPRIESADKYVDWNWAANLRPGDGTIPGQ